MWTWIALEILFSGFSDKLIIFHTLEMSIWALMLHIRAHSIHFWLMSCREACGFPALIERYPGLLPMILGCQSLSNLECVCCSGHLFSQKCQIFFNYVSGCSFPRQSKGRWAAIIWLSTWVCNGLFFCRFYAVTFRSAVKLPITDCCSDATRVNVH